MIVRVFIWVCLVAVVAGSGCPVNQRGRQIANPQWMDEFRLHAGETVTIEDGSVTLTLTELEPGDRVAFATILLRRPTGDQSEERIKVVRNADLSVAVTVDPYIAQIVGFPGVDTALIRVTRY